MPDVEPVCPPDMSDCAKKCKFGTSDNSTKLTSCENPCSCHDDPTRPPAILDEETGECNIQNPYGTCPCTGTTDQLWTYESCTDPSWIPTGNQTRMYMFQWSVTPYSSALGNRYVQFNIGPGNYFLTIGNGGPNSGSVAIGPWNSNEIEYIIYNANYQNYVVTYSMSCSF